LHARESQTKLSHFETVVWNARQVSDRISCRATRPRYILLSQGFENENVSRELNKKSLILNRQILFLRSLKSGTKTVVRIRTSAEYICPLPAGPHRNLSKELCAVNLYSGFMGRRVLCYCLFVGRPRVRGAWCGCASGTTSRSALTTAVSSAKTTSPSLVIVHHDSEPPGWCWLCPVALYAGTQPPRSSD
jgi:hypothetical protein